MEFKSFTKYIDLVSGKTRILLSDYKLLTPELSYTPLQGAILSAFHIGTEVPKECTPCHNSEVEEVEFELKASNHQSHSLCLVNFA